MSFNVRRTHGDKVAWSSIDGPVIVVSKRRAAQIHPEKLHDNELVTGPMPSAWPDLVKVPMEGNGIIIVYPPGAYSVVYWLRARYSAMQVLLKSKVAAIVAEHSADSPIIEIGIER